MQKFWYILWRIMPVIISYNYQIVSNVIKVNYLAMIADSVKRIIVSWNHLKEFYISTTKGSSDRNYGNFTIYTFSL